MHSSHEGLGCWVWEGAVRRRQPVGISAGRCKERQAHKPASCRYPLDREDGEARARTSACGKRKGWEGWERWVGGYGEGETVRL